MVNASAALIAFLELNLPFFGADLYTFTLPSGSIIRATSFDRRITYSGDVYTPLGPYVSRSKLKVSVGTEVSTLTVQITSNPTDMVGSQSVLLAIAQGKFSHASVTVRRAFLTPGDVALATIIPNLTGCPSGTGDGTIVRFVGFVGQVSDVTTLTATLEIRDVLYYLNRPAPKNVHQASCWHTFCDAGCTLDAADFTTTGSVHAGSTTVTINTGLTQDASIPTAPTGAPSLTIVSSDTILPWTGYYVVITYVTKYGETTKSPEAFIAAPPGNIVKVTSPSNPGGGTVGWNVYIGDGSGNEQLQTSVPQAFGSDFTASVEGIYQSGIIPPQIPSTGYWAQGRITFTSGVLSGVSAYIQGSDATGAIALAVPLPSAPATGVTFSIFAGCSKTVSACQSRVKISGASVDNTNHFTGVPATPTPEIGVA